MGGQVKQSRSEFIEIGGLQVHVRRWGTPGAPRIFMLHGWMDCSASFQFMVDHLAYEWDIVAPDWRGFGASAWQGSSYWFPDYVADLDCVLERYAGDAPAVIVGHSMGANVTGMFAALYPERVARFVNLDAYGTTLLHPIEEYPEQLGAWVRARGRGPAPERSYPDIAAFATRLMSRNPRLAADRALFLAQHLTRRDEEGRVVLGADPWHRIISPVLQQGTDMSFWRRIRAPILWVTATGSHLKNQFEEEPEHRREWLAGLPNVTHEEVPDAGHNLHHDQPERVAALTEAFLLREEFPTNSFACRAAQAAPHRASAGQSGDCWGRPR
jgi:pimeloyl-ACP methyl ester carboxylesterase